MNGFFSFLGKTRGKNVAIVDVSTATVGAAFATTSGIAPPALVHMARYENQSDSGSMPGMLRALDMVARDMTEAGAPALREATGSGSVTEAYVLISPPWQVSSLSAKVIEKEKSFIFTEGMLAEALAETAKEKGATTLMGSVLNGYEAPNPVGKKTTRAEILLLSSKIDQEVEGFIRKAVRSFVGATPIKYVSFPAVAHAVLRGLFPHERDFLAIRVGADATELALVKQEHLAGVDMAPLGTEHFAKAAREHGIVSPGGVHDSERGIIDTAKSARLSERLSAVEAGWLSTMREAFIRIASEGALPRVIFLFADERSLQFFKRLLDSPELHALWLSDEPLSIIPVGRRHFFQFMRHVKDDYDDAVLDMLALVSRVEG